MPSLESRRDLCFILGNVCDRVDIFYDLLCNNLLWLRIRRHQVTILAYHSYLLVYPYGLVVGSIQVELKMEQNMEMNDSNQPESL